MVLSSELTETGVTSTSMKISSSSDPPPKRKILVTDWHKHHYIFTSLLNGIDLEHLHDVYRLLQLSSTRRQQPPHKQSVSHPSQCCSTSSGIRNVDFANKHQHVFHLAMFKCFCSSSAPLPVGDVQVFPQNICRMWSSLAPTTSSF